MSTDAVNEIQDLKRALGVCHDVKGEVSRELGEIARGLEALRVALRLVSGNEDNDAPLKPELISAFLDHTVNDAITGLKTNIRQVDGLLLSM